MAIRDIGSMGKLAYRSHLRNIDMNGLYEYSLTFPAISSRFRNS